MRIALAFVSCLTLSPALLAQSPAPRDTPPPSIENARRERELQASVDAETATKETYFELAKLALVQNRIDAAVQALEGAAKLVGPSAESHHVIAAVIWDYTRNTALDTSRKLGYIRKGIDYENAALAMDPDYLSSVTYKSILLRAQANLTADPTEQKRLIDEADALRNRALELQKHQGEQRPAGAPPPPAAPFAGFSEPFEQALARLQPLRVGGNVKPPVKVKDVKPTYPAEAQAARIQGVVIIEALVDDQGNIANARVLRSIPMLDEAALGAVSQWQFAPTLLNGSPVPILLTVTVNFTLQ